MFDSLHAPTDLGDARARLGIAADRLAGSGSLAHLGPVDGSASWPAIDATAGVVVADAVLWRASQHELRALAAAIGPDRSLVFLEPTAEIGWRRLAHRLGRPLWRRTAGHHFEVDLPSTLRAAGLEVVDLNRFGIGPAQVRSYALGRAITGFSPG